MYNTQYFIDKFSRIPEYLWYTGAYVDPANPYRCCAFGHCGLRSENHFTYHDEASALTALFYKLCVLAGDVNDGFVRDYPQPSPKQRILAALRDIQRMEEIELTDPPITAEQLIESMEQVPQLV